MRAYTLPATVALAMLVTGTLDAASSGHDTKQGPFAGQATSAAPAITDVEGRTPDASGQGQGGLAAERNASALPPPRRIEGIDVKGWHQRAVRNRRQINRMRHAYLERPTVVEAVNLACATYGHCRELWSKARCESHLNHRARNLSSGAAGVYQFLRGTWASTPYGRFNVYSPYANALAAGWMHAHGRGGEWVCR